MPPGKSSPVWNGSVTSTPLVLSGRFERAGSPDALRADLTRTLAALTDPPRWPVTAAVIEVLVADEDLALRTLALAFLAEELAEEA